MMEDYTWEYDHEESEAYNSFCFLEKVLFNLKFIEEELGGAFSFRHYCDQYEVENE